MCVLRNTICHVEPDFHKQNIDRSIANEYKDKASIDYVATYLVSWSVTKFTCVPPLMVHIELTKLTCKSRANVRQPR